MISWELANHVEAGGVNWIRTKNYFYIPERLLWQTGIVRRIFFSKYKYFVFEGAIAHLPTWLFAALCRISGKKALFWTHGLKGTDRGIKKMVRQIYFKLPHALLLYGDFSKGVMVKGGFNAKRLFVIYNSLDVNKQLTIFKNYNNEIVKAEKARIFSNPAALTLIFIGRLVQAKGVMQTVEAVRDLVADHFPVNLILIGTGPELAHIKDLIAEHRLEKNIHLAGEIYNEETICKYFKMADLLLSPGGVGLNCMHSMAYGVPVLTHDDFRFQSPEVEAIVPGSTGIFFQYGNYQDMLAKIRNWNNFGKTKEEIVRNCQSMMEHRYNPASHAQEIIKAIDSL